MSSTITIHLCPLTPKPEVPRSKGLVILVDGPIGVGKSTFMKYMMDNIKPNSNYLGYKFFFEPSGKEDVFYGIVKNPYLDGYYTEPSKWAYLLQFWMLLTRWNQIQEAKELKEKGFICFLDRSIFSDDIFAKLIREEGKITEFESLILELLRKLIVETVGFKSVIDHIIYIKSDMNSIKNRIGIRDHGAENNLLTPSFNKYLITLNQKYDEFYQQSNYAKWISPGRIIPLITVTNNETAECTGEYSTPNHNLHCPCFLNSRWNCIKVGIQEYDGVKKNSILSQKTQEHTITMLSGE